MRIDTHTVPKQAFCGCKWRVSDDLWVLLIFCWRNNNTIILIQLHRLHFAHCRVWFQVPMVERLVTDRENELLRSVNVSKSFYWSFVAVLAKTFSELFYLLIPLLRIALLQQLLLHLNQSDLHSVQSKIRKKLSNGGKLILNYTFQVIISFFLASERWIESIQVGNWSDGHSASVNVRMCQR